MKIVFICGSLKQGCDGVGDYTRRLSGELIRQGHQVRILALFDVSVQMETYEYQLSDTTEISTLRIPVHSDTKLRTIYAKNWINAFNPDWLSLQFVPFSFQPKGLPYRLGAFLKRLGGDRNWHVMFHELWIGMHQNAPGKELVWGYLQRLTILRLLKKLKPKLIHSQSSLYQFQLDHLGFNAILLPLFSNIPFVKAHVSVPEREKLRFVLFGGIHNTNGPVRQFAEELKRYSQKLNKPVSLTIIGRGGKEEKNWEQIWKVNGLEINLLGEQSVEEVSKALQIADFGITTTVYDKIEKSGSVSAMIEHGLNVICIAGPWKSRISFEVKRGGSVYEYKQGKLDEFFDLNEVKQSDLLKDVTSNLIADLNDIL